MTYREKINLIRCIHNIANPSIISFREISYSGFLFGIRFCLKCNKPKLNGSELSNMRRIVSIIGAIYVLC